MPAPGLNVQRDQPEVNVVMAKPTVTVRQEDPKVDVNVDARLVHPGIAVPDNQKPSIQTGAQRVNSQGKSVSDRRPMSRYSKVKPSIRFMTTDVQDEVHFSRANPQIRYEAAQPNVEVTFNDEPRVEIHQTGEPKVSIRRSRRNNQAAMDNAKLAAMPASSRSDRSRMTSPMPASGPARAQISRPATRRLARAPVQCGGVRAAGCGAARRPPRAVGQPGAGSE